MVPLAGRRLAKDARRRRPRRCRPAPTSPRRSGSPTPAPDLYPEPFAFRPERFLDEGPDTYAWIPFGGGIRRCLGAAFAEFEMRIVLREVLTRCELHKAEPARRRRSAAATSPSRRKDGTPVVVTARHPAREPRPGRGLARGLERRRSTGCPVSRAYLIRSMAEAAMATADARWQALWRLAPHSHRAAGSQGPKRDEPLTSDDWAAYFAMASDPTGRTLEPHAALASLQPRCGICGAPFSGFGSRLVRPLGYRPSRKSPNLCATCVEPAPPGGMTTEAGVLFADIRGFTRLSEQRDPEEVSALLRRFYASAEHVLFPEAIIDKLIGDEVMALYLPMYGALRGGGAGDARHARELLARRRLRQARAPFAEVGIGLDYGEAFVGNVGQRSSTTSPRSATSSTPPPGCRARRRAARSSPPRASSNSCRERRRANGSSST